MALMFTRPHPVVRRAMGSYVDGVWISPVETVTVEVALNLQPASQTDYERLQAASEGRRTSALMLALANIGADLNVAGDSHPGDIVLYDNARWLVIGESRWEVFGDPDVDHMEYLLAQEIERGPGEMAA